jgi:hypothetical protein
MTRTAIMLTLSVCLARGSLAAMPVQPEASTCTEAASPRGAWEKPGDATQVLFKDDQVVIRKNGFLSVATVLKREPCKLLVRYQGLRSIWTVTPDHGMLRLQTEEPLTLRPLAKVPPELDLDLPALPAPGPVSPAEVKAVEEELLNRVKKDQDAAKDAALQAKRPEILADNLRYLQALTQRVGWIDIPRFGKSSASAAILIAKHESDLRLMRAALPIVERDVKEHGGSGEMFSVLYDELQITLGHKQRYGTQISADAKGNPIILPLEDPDRVDGFRKEIGILSFKDYLKLASDNMGGVAIRVAAGDE